MTEKDSEQDRLIRENAERIARNEEAIKRQTEALEKIRDHYYPPPKKPWRKVIGFLAKACCAVFAYLGIAETVDWIWNARESGKLAERYAEVAQRLFLCEGDAAGAVRCYEKAVSFDPKESQYAMAQIFFRGMALVSKGFGNERPLTNAEQANVGEVYAEASVLKDLNPDNPMPYVLMAQALMLNGEKAEAVTTIERARALAPDQPSIHVSGCAINFFAGRVPEARRCIAEAERLDPTLPYVQIWKGFIALQADRDVTAAQRFFRESIRRAPRLALGHALLGRALLADAKPDLATARAAFSRALAVDARLTLAMLGLSETYEREGNRIVARLWLDRVLAIDETLMPALVARARLTLADGDSAAALADLTKAIGLAPFRADLYRLRSEAHEKAGDAKGAKRDRQTADALQAI